MTLKFDKEGFAIDGGDIRVFYFEPMTGEYVGWSDEYIYEGVSMPGSSTVIDPGNEVSGAVSVFDGKKWRREEDHRGETVYSKTDGIATTVDYIGKLKSEFVTVGPATQYDKWNGSEWVTDIEAKHAADIAAADTDKQARIGRANEFINGKQWPGKAAMGRLKDAEKAQYNSWLDYLDALEAIETSSAPDINWPVAPVE